MESESLRLLVLDADARSALASGLAERAEVVHETQLEAARARLRDEVFDLSLLRHPLGSEDLIACCAALRPDPAEPPVLLIDEEGRADQQIRLVPRQMRPLAVAESCEASKLWPQIEALASEASDSGERAGESLPEALLRLAAARATGVVEIRSDGVCTRVFLRDGSAILAEGGSLRETLGRMLLRQGVLSEENYVRVIDRMTERLVENEAVRVGEVLVELGLLQPNEVFEALSQQVIEKITASFRWEHTSHDFEASGDAPSHAPAFTLPSIPTLVYRGIRDHFGSSRIEELLRSRAGSFPALSADPAALAKRFSLDAEEQALVARIDGRSTVGTLSRDPRTAALLVTLSLDGAIDWGNAPRPKSSAAAESPTKRTVRKRRAPPAQTAPPVASGPTDDARAKLEAESRFRRGESFVAQGRVQAAHEAFAEAVELQPYEPEYRMFEAWTAFLTARAESRTQQARAYACALRMTEHDPNNVRALVIAGSMAREGGRLDMAEHAFEAALVRDPENEEAKRGLRAARAEKRRAEAGD